MNHPLRLSVSGILLSASILLTLFACIGQAYAFDVPPNDGFMTEATDRSKVPQPLISETQDAQLETLLEEYRRQTSNEIAVVILQTLEDEPIEDIGLEIGREWGVGSAKSNGILIVVGYEEREVRIEVGYGLEGAVPDIVAGGIIETDIVPAFRNGDYYGGITAAIDALQKHIGNEYTAERYAEPEGDGFGFPAVGFFFLFILFEWLISVLGRTKSWWLGGVIGGVGGIVLTALFSWWLSIPVLIVIGLVLDFFVSRNYKSRGKTRWWAGGGWGPGGKGGWGGGSGGGFGGFGGGSFGGGGASGRW